MQTQLTFSHAQVQELKDQTRALNDIANILAAQANLAEEDRIVKSNQVTDMAKGDYSDGFINMLQADRSSSDFTGGRRVN